MGKEPKPVEDERLKKELEEKGLDEEGRPQDPPPGQHITPPPPPD
jgi:hypothetical protein